MLEASPLAPPVTDERQSAVWRTALLLSLVAAIAIGFGRFAYGLVLPAMKADLGFSYSQLGALNTSNAAGYLLGAFICTFVVRRVGTRALMKSGFAASVIALAAHGLAHTFWALLLCRFAVGLSASACYISATGLAATLGRTQRENTLALGITISGGGLGVAFTGITLPFLLGGHDERWPLAWLALGGIGLVGFVTVLFGTRSLREASSAATENTAPAPRFTVRPLVPTFVSYFGFGLGYIAYMTFLVAFVRSHGASAATVALTWAALGAAMYSAPWVWQKRLRTESGGTTLAMMGALGGVSALLPLFSEALPVLLLSAVGFGVASMGVFTAVAVLIRRHLPPPSWTRAIACATAIFALGQMLGPVGSGFASDHLGPAAALWWTFLIMTGAGLIALLQKPKQETS